MAVNELLDSGDPSLYEVITNAPGPQGKLPLSADMLRNQPSGDAFGMTHNAGMGWPPETRLWAALQRLGGGTWGGCVFDVDKIVERLEAK